MQRQSLLIWTDHHGSMLGYHPTGSPARRYTIHGYCARGNQPGVLGFNGEPLEPSGDCYLLGHGYRAYRPALMRFASPDRWSPFAAGGVNCYGYCAGDPVNATDPTGRFTAASITRAFPWRPSLTKTLRRHSVGAISSKLAGLPLDINAHVIGRQLLSRTEQLSSAFISTRLTKTGYPLAGAFQPGELSVASSLFHTEPHMRYKLLNFIATQPPSPAGHMATALLDDIWKTPFTNLSADQRKRALGQVSKAIRNAPDRRFSV